MTEISVVIPTYRRPALVERAVASCLDQQGAGAAVEVIVIDNDPAESARPAIEPLAAANPGTVRYIVERRPGISHARNSGVAAASGRFIAFLDDDEAAEPGWLAALLRTLRQTGADAAMGPVYPHVPAEQAYARRIYTRDARLPTGTRLVNWSKLNGLFDKAKCFGTAEPPFRPDLGLSGGEDTLFLRQLFKRGGHIVWCAEAAVWETIPPEKLVPRYLLRRRFHAGQLTTYVRTAVRPPEWGRAAFWMLAGCAQLALYGPAALALRAFGRERWLPPTARAMGGLGKILWHPGLHGRLYR